jgi:hypothetical protein
MDLPLEPIVHLQGRRGATETLWRQRLEIEGPREIALRLRATGPEIR